jgi:hypothetical protein
LPCFSRSQAENLAFWAFLPSFWGEGRRKWMADGDVRSMGAEYMRLNHEMYAKGLRFYWLTKVPWAVSEDSTQSIH